MTSLLYYSLASGLTDNEIIEIDKKVLENRQQVYLVGKKLMLRFLIIVESTRPLGAVIVPLPVPIERVSQTASHQYRREMINKNSFQLAPVPLDRIYKIQLTKNEITDTELNNIILQLKAGSSIEDIILRIRGGKDHIIVQLIWLGIAVYAINQHINEQKAAARLEEPRQHNASVPNESHIGKRSYRKVHESFKSNDRLQTLTKRALENQDVKNEYRRIKNLMAKGVDPMNINRKSIDLGYGLTYVRGKYCCCIVRNEHGIKDVLYLCLTDQKTI